MGLSFSNASHIASSVALFVLASLLFWFLGFKFYLSYLVHYFLYGMFFSIFFALLILFFVIFLLALLSALSRDFVSYSLVVICNYVITSTLILFKALFYSKVVNSWRRSLTETFLLNFLSFSRLKLSILAFFLNSLRSCLLLGLDCESLLILLARCTFVGLKVLITIIYIYN